MQSALNQGEQRAMEAFVEDPSPDSYGVLFHALWPRMLGYFRACGCQRDLAEDLTQDVMFAVYRQIRSLRNLELFRPWLFKIARNALAQHLRNQQRQPATAELDPRRLSAPKTDPAACVWFAEWLAWLQPPERQILRMRYVDGFEYHEIAALLQIPMGTVQWKVFRSKRKLAARLGAKAA